MTDLMSLTWMWFVMSETITLKHCPEAMRPHLDRVLQGEYDLPPNLRWKEKAISSVLDIGANVGAFTMWARRKWPEAEIHAYEPVAVNFDQMFRNVEGMGVSTFCRAVADKDGAADFYLGASNEGEGSFYLTPEQNPEQKVRVRTVDAASLMEFGFVKIDAEGAERMILERLRLDQTRGIGLEWHSAEDRVWIVRHLTSHGFDLVKDDVVHHTRGTQVWARREWIEPNVLSGKGVEGKEIYLALPVYGDYEANFVHSLMRLMQEKPAPARIRIATLAGDSLIARARNVLASRFLRSSATHLLFIDTDLIFSPAHIAKIASHDEPIVAGLYPKKQRELGWVCNLLDEPTPPRNDGLQPAKYAGTGFLMIAREVFEAMIAAHPEIEYDPDEGDESGLKWDFFATGVWKCPSSGRRRYLSEDWMFCQRARDLGFSILIDTSIVCKHVGKFIYPVAPEEEWSEPAKD